MPIQNAYLLFANLVTSFEKRMSQPLMYEFTLDLC